MSAVFVMHAKSFVHGVERATYYTILIAVAYGCYLQVTELGAWLIVGLLFTPYLFNHRHRAQRKRLLARISRELDPSHPVLARYN